MTPTRHAFTFRTFMMYLDLEELPGLFRGAVGWSSRRPSLAWYRRADFLGDRGIPLEEAVRSRVASETGETPSGPIRMLTHLRYFGHSFNPVTLYYCFDQHGETVETIVAEITNTPWRERHAYVLPVDRARRSSRAIRWRFDKRFYVSPFMPMEMGYDWSFTEPGDGLFVHMNVAPRGDTSGYQESGARESGSDRPPKAFDATLKLERREISRSRLGLLLLRYPAHTASVVARIYFEAMRLRLKGVHGVSRKGLEQGVAPDAG